jgi:hypothetical protein
MINPSLSSMYKELIEFYRENQKKLGSKNEILTQEIDEIQQKIRQLKQNLNAYRKQREILTATRTRLERQLPAKEREFAVRALEGSFRELATSGAYWQNIRRLINEIEDLESEDPELRKKIEDYEQFEEIRDQIEQFPITYRERILQEHSRIARQLQPYRELRTELRSLKPPSQLIFNIAVLEVEDSETIWWVVPYRRDDELPSDVADAICDVVWEVVNQIANLGQEPDWVFDDISVDSWEGYDALVTQGMYDESEAMAVAATSYLQKQITTLPVFGRFVPTVDVAVLPNALRSLVTDETIEPESDTVEEYDGVELVELTGGWFSSDDVQSWAAPLNVVEGSMWNEQARRLRTLLIRLISKGCVGDGGVSHEQLIQHLPEPHDQFMRDGIERMLEADLLMHTEQENGDTITLNPSMLTDTQFLINREVTPFWAGIIATSE